MYKVSEDRRFKKVKKEIRRAFIDLVLEKGYPKLTISDIAERADINRMTFYAHYDEIEDVFNEFIDDMEAEIAEAVRGENDFDIDKFFTILNELMYKEIDFFRYVAKQGNMAAFRSAFKETISQLIRVDLKVIDGYSKEKQHVVSNLTAVCIAYSYLEWLAGEYGDMELSEVTQITKELLKGQIANISYRKEM